MVMKKGETRTFYNPKTKRKVKIKRLKSGKTKILKG